MTDGNIDQIRVCDKGLEVIEHQHLVIALFFNCGIQAVLEVAEIHHTDFRVILGQVGHKAVRVAVLDHQNTACAAALDR